MKTAVRLSVLVCAAGLATSAMAQVTIPEIEANETKATATLASGLVANDMLVGNSTGSSTVAGPASLDTWRVGTAPAPLGIYRWRLAITTTGTAGHVGSIRGLTQTAAAQAPWLPGQVVGTPTTTDTAFQTSSTLTTPTRFNQWYGFGKAEEIYYRVTGAAATTADYKSTLECQQITPVNIGSFQPGAITISTLGQGHTTDTDFWVYNSNFDAIRGYGNDDEAITAVSGVPGATGTTLQSVLNRNYAPGTYYIAMSNFALANNQASPSDDDFRTGALLDFANAVANSSTTVNLNMQFSVTDGVGPAVVVPNTKVGAYDVNWFCFTVVPAPSSLALLGLGGLILGRRRR
ncbi:MAG: PEP-CTERM sorting domain-containing protein [Phycisphaerales bacterium]